MRKPLHKAAGKRAADRDPDFSHAVVWASLGLTAYIVTFILAILFGAPGPLPFAYAGLALFAILAVEVLMRGKLWIFEPKFSAAFGHPQVAHRLTYFSVGLVLLLESSIIGYLFLK